MAVDVYNFNAELNSILLSKIYIHTKLEKGAHILFLRGIWIINLTWLVIEFIFRFWIQFPPNYPEKEPEVCFLIQIYHANINLRVPTSPDGEVLGHVCISALNLWKPEKKF